jgi:hypothetical protein
MALFTISQERYYNNSTNFTGTGSQQQFTLTTAMFNPLPTAKTQFKIFVSGKQISPGNYSYSSPNISFSGNTNNTDVLESNGSPKAGLKIIVIQTDAVEQLGSYQNITLEDVVNNFMISYVGEEKIIPKIKRTNVLFFAQRAIQELSYDTLRSKKAQEIEVPDSLEMKLPHDFVNQVSVTFIDDAGVERPLYPARVTSNPTALLQGDDFNYIFDNTGKLLTANESETRKRYKNQNTPLDTSSDFYLKDEDGFQQLKGNRYGINPEFANENGEYYIDYNKGKILFSGHLTGKIVTLKYISDGVATAEEKLIHKFAEEAMYKSIAYSILSTRANTPEYLVNRFRKEKFAATRQAKLRLSNLKARELTQVLRGKSKHIKH